MICLLFNLIFFEESKLFILVEIPCCQENENASKHPISTPHLLLLSWQKLNLILLLDQFRLTLGDECWW